MYIRNKKHVFLLSGSWLLINVLIYLHTGIKYAIDTARFDAEASAWVNGTFEFSYHFWYTGYITLLALCKLLFHSIYPSIVIQCGISLISICLFYIGVRKMIKNEWIAFIAALLIIVYLPIQQWNVCLLTESFFISSVLLFIRAASLQNKRPGWICLFLIAILSTTLRPNGGILLLTALLLAAKECITPGNRYYIYTAGAVIAGCLLMLLNTTTAVFYQFLSNSFNKGEIICGYSGWTVPIKSSVEQNNADGSIIKIIQLFIAHPFESLQLLCFRFIALWADVRPYYSNLHNLFIAFFLLSSYFFASIGMFHYRKKYTDLFFMTVTYTGLNSLLIMITYADWDGRFLAPLLPMIFIWSGLGIYFSIQFLKRKNTLL